MSDPIGAVAVIGMAGRFPGAADVERFWENLRAGVHSITFFDAEEGGINLYLGGHYATEVWGVRALAEHLQQKFGIEWFFIDHPTGL